MEHEQGKLTSQERFWQARLMAKETAHQVELTSIHHQLNELKTTTELAKVELNEATRNAAVKPDTEMNEDYFIRQQIGIVRLIVLFELSASKPETLVC